MGKKKKSATNDESILRELLATAVEAGAEKMEIEYEAGEDVVYAFQGNMGIGITAFRSNGPESQQMRDELWKMRRKRTRIEIAGVEYILRVKEHYSFAEMAFQVRIEEA